MHDGAVHELIDDVAGHVTPGQHLSDGMLAQVDGGQVPQRAPGSLPPGTTVYLANHGATENLANSYTVPGDDLDIFTDLSTVFTTAWFIIP